MRALELSAGGLAKTESPVAKNKEAPGLPGRNRRSTFPSASQGKPGGDPDRRVRSGESRLDTDDTGPGAIGRPRATGTIGRSDGDPSGSSSGLRTAGLTTCKDFSETRSAIFGSQTAGDFGQRQNSTRSWVPGPIPMGESPERVEASAKAPSGLSRVDCAGGGDPPAPPARGRARTGCLNRGFHGCPEPG